MVSMRTLSLASMYQLATLAVAGLVTMWRWPNALSGVLLGGLVMVLNFAAARALASRVIGQANPKAIYVLGLGLKFFFMLGLVASILYFLQPDVLGFGAGLLTFFAGVLLAMAHQTFATRDTVSNPS